MCVRGFSLGLSLALVAVAQAGVDVQLVPTPAGPYNAGDLVDVDVLLVQTEPGTTNPCTPATCSPHRLRMIQFDLINSDPALLITLPRTHDLGSPLNPADDIHFWFFGGLTGCSMDPTTCGAGHFIIDDPNSGIPPGPKNISITFGSSTQLVENPNLQLLLPDDGMPITVGKMQVQLPTPAPNPQYVLDIVNAALLGPDNSGQARYGFGCPGAPGACTDPITALRANGSLEVTGGTLTLNVGLPPVAPICQGWQSIGVHGTVGEVGMDIPADGSYSEPRLTGINKLVVTFDSPIDVSAAFATVTGIDKLGAVVDVSPFSFPVTAGPGNTAVISVVDAISMAPAKLPGSDFAGHVPAKYCVVLDGVTGPGPGFPAATACNRVMTVVLGDAFGAPFGSGKGDLLVNAADNGLVRSLASQGVGTSTPFDPNNLLHVRSDVFTNGTIDAADNGLARSLASQGLNGTGISIACP